MTDTSEWKCPRCGHQCPPTFDFCWNCGSDREGEVVVPVEPDLTPPPAPANAPQINPRIGLALLWMFGTLVVGCGLMIGMELCRGDDGRWTTPALFFLILGAMSFAVSVASAFAAFAFLISPLPGIRFGDSTPPDEADGDVG